MIGFSSSSTRARRRVAAVLVPVLLGALGACTGRDGGGATAGHHGVRPAAPRLETFVGRLDGTDAFVAVETVDGREVRAYVCDGAAMIHWLDGSLTGDRVDAAARDGAGTLSATRRGDGFTGSVLGHSFTLTRAAFPAGLYRAADPRGVIEGSWIVLADGSQRGSAVKDKQAAASSVSPTDLQATVGGESTTAVSGGTGGIQDATPLKKEITLKEKCDNLQHSYDAQAVHRSQNLHKTPPNIAGANADLDIMKDLLAAMENLGC